MHAIDEDENVFKANVWENTDTSNNVGTINLYVPQSLIDNKEGTYNNVVLDYTTKDRGVAFAVINGDVNSGDIRLAKLSRTENDQSTSWISGTVIDEDASTDAIAGVNSNYNTEVNTIVVLPEKIARAVEGGYAHDTRTEKDVIESSKIWKYGTVYSVKIESQEYKHDRDLISFKVGSSVLTVNEAEGTIEGTLNWADTTTIPQGKKLLLLLTLCSPPLS